VVANYSSYFVDFFTGLKAIKGSGPQSSTGKFCVKSNADWLVNVYYLFLTHIIGSPERSKLLITEKQTGSVNPSLSSANPIFRSVYFVLLSKTQGQPATRTKNLNSGL
jgi:hypothetical protein